MFPTKGCNTTVAFLLKRKKKKELLPMSLSPAVDILLSNFVLDLVCLVRGYQLLKNCSFKKMDASIENMGAYMT